MTSSKPHWGGTREWGKTVPTIGGKLPLRSAKRKHAGPAKPTTLFKRSNVGFGGGEGLEVQLVKEPGYTKQGWLDVPFRFMVPPLDSLARTREHSHPTYEVVGGDDPGERSRSSGVRLSTVQFKTVFLNWLPEWAVWPTPGPTPEETQGTMPPLDPVTGPVEDVGVLEPLLAVAELEALAKDGVRFRLRIGNSRLYDYDDVNMVAVILTANAEEVAGEPDARYLNISFQEWKPTEIERMSVKNVLGPWTHKIAAHDTLYSISRHYYKTTSLWQLIAHANPGMERVAPSSQVLASWARAHHRTSIRVPQKPTTQVALSTAAGTRGIVLP